MVNQRLCDILDVIDHHPRLKTHGAAYGPDRHLANLQAFGVWQGNESLNQPSARELFATAFSSATAGAANDLRSPPANCSPAPQGSGPGGELIGPPLDGQTPPVPPPPSPQAVDGVLVVTIAADSGDRAAEPDSTGIVHHRTDNPGEQSPAAADPRLIAARPLRRGRPPALDDLAKGRLLGLMSYGLSFRQAAAQLGVHHVTLLNAMKRDEAFAQQVSEARLEAISQPLLIVVQASRTNWRAAAWLAKFLEDRRVRTLESTPEERALQSSRQSM
jgi:hypothetical protein